MNKCEEESGVLRNDSAAGNKKTLPYLPFLPVCEDWSELEKDR